MAAGISTMRCRVRATCISDGIVRKIFSIVNREYVMRVQSGVLIAIGAL